MSNPKDQEPYIWLQEGEDSASADCGCRLYHMESGGQESPAFRFCPLHAAARELLKACKAARISLVSDEHYQEFKPVIKALEVAISLTKPPKKAGPGWFA